jgi:hypothetical protein
MNILRIGISKFNGRAQELTELAAVVARLPAGGGDRIAAQHLGISVRVEMRAVRRAGSGPAGGWDVPRLLPATGSAHRRAAVGALPAVSRKTRTGGDGLPHFTPAPTPSPHPSPPRPRAPRRRTRVGRAPRHAAPYRLRPSPRPWQPRRGALGVMSPPPLATRRCASRAPAGGAGGVSGSFHCGRRLGACAATRWEANPTPPPACGMERRGRERKAAGRDGRDANRGGRSEIDVEMDEAGRAERMGPKGTTRIERSGASLPGSPGNEGGWIERGKRRGGDEDGEQGGRVGGGGGW